MKSIQLKKFRKGYLPDPFQQIRSYLPATFDINFVILCNACIIYYVFEVTPSALSPCFPSLLRDKKDTF